MRFFSSSSTLSSSGGRRQLKHSGTTCPGSYQTLWAWGFENLLKCLRGVFLFITGGKNPDLFSGINYQALDCSVNFCVKSRCWEPTASDTEICQGTWALVSDSLCSSTGRRMEGLSPSTEVQGGLKEMVKLLSSLIYLWKCTSVLIFLCIPSKDTYFQTLPSCSSEHRKPHEIKPVHELPNFMPSLQSRVHPATAPEKVISQTGILIDLMGHSGCDGALLKP